MSHVRTDEARAVAGEGARGCVSRILLHGGWHPGDSGARFAPASLVVPSLDSAPPPHDPARLPHDFRTTSAPPPHQVYDPTVVRERYTTHGDEVNVVKSKHDPGLAPLKGFAPTH